ncbi:PP2C family serine/threonine-protein phosphatase [Herbaspirillum sp. SJZ107]|uniref:PP2C family protein-serine/threonine phosphatase n=1 Tax=Herbaspirillum sp. SJZ107 TaxID=2572881 RepID=UPI001151F203|nr:PP2C family serine/threonine-protein phosphatase [Herbaspirillum sp. SJZ107]TQK03564.1 protein phosphatase [Herbaspirillum sp. SJZ107]
MACDTDLRWTSAARTDVGRVRIRNEDACLDQPARGLWAVADGMGGHAFGDLASGAVVAALDGLPDPAGLPACVEAARARLGAVNGALRADARARGVPVIGSTVVALFARGREAACLWAGDSRLYLLRQGRLQQLTRDHSQAEAWRDSGGDLAAATASPNMITRAVGAADAIEFDVTTLPVRDGDVFLLCSDGLSTPVDEAAIATALAPGDCERAARDLVALALAHGGRDNVTVVVVRADDPSGDKTVLNPAL